MRVCVCVSVCVQTSSLSVFVSAIEESLRNVRLLLLAFLEVFARVSRSINEQCSASAPEPEAPTERQALLDALPVKRELQVRSRICCRPSVRVIRRALRLCVCVCVCV